MAAHKTVAIHCFSATSKRGTVHACRFTLVYKKLHNMTTDVCMLWIEDNCLLDGEKAKALSHRRL